MAPIAFDATGSALNAGHELALGTPVRVTRGGTVQPWANVVVHRHDRNGTYRLRFLDNDTFVTAHADEVEAVTV